LINITYCKVLKTSQIKTYLQSTNEGDNTVSENDTDVAHYNFDADQPILIIFGRDVAEIRPTP